MIGSQFLCLARSGTKFQFAVDKPVPILEADCYKGKEKMDPQHAMLKQDQAGSNMKQLHCIKSENLQAGIGKSLQRYYKLGAHYSGMEPEENPSLDGVHHKINRCYQTINHNSFVVDSLSNRVCQWKRYFATVSECNFSFIVKLPYSTFTFVHQVHPIIEEVNFDDEVLTFVVVDMAM